MVVVGFSFSVMLDILVVTLPTSSMVSLACVISSFDFLCSFVTTSSVFSLIVICIPLMSAVSSFDTRFATSFAVFATSSSWSMNATAHIPLRVCRGVLGSAPTWNSASASVTSIGVVPDGASSPLASSHVQPDAASGMSPLALLVSAAVPVHLVLLPFSAWGVFHFAV